MGELHLRVGIAVRWLEVGTWLPAEPWSEGAVGGETAPQWYPWGWWGRTGLHVVHVPLCDPHLHFSLTCASTDSPNKKKRSEVLGEILEQLEEEESNKDEAL